MKNFSIVATFVVVAYLTKNSFISDISALRLPSDPICGSLGCEKYQFKSNKTSSDPAPVYDSDIMSTMKTIEDAEKGKFKVNKK